MSETTKTPDVQTLEWWTVREVANRWRVSIDTVIRMIERGEVAGRKFGGQWRIHNTAVESFEQGGKPRRPPSARPAAVIDRGDPLGLYSAAPSRGRNR